MISPNYYAEVVRWAEKLPEPQSESDVPHWVSILDRTLVQYCGIPKPERTCDGPCAAAACKTCKDFRAAEGRYPGRCNHRTAAAVWAAAVGEFRRVAEAAMAEKAIG